VLDRSKVKVDRVTRDAAGLRIGIHGYRGHGYQLQSKPNLTSGNWQNLGTSVVGSDATLEFTAPSAAGSRTGFYRISVTP
jgi:hypothetical protein